MSSIPVLNYVHMGLMNLVKLYIEYTVNAVSGMVCLTEIKDLKLTSGVSMK